MLKRLDCFINIVKLLIGRVKDFEDDQVCILERKSESMLEDELPKNKSCSGVTWDLYYSNSRQMGGNCGLRL